MALFEKKLLLISLASMLFFGSIDTLRSIVTPMLQEDLRLSYLQVSGAFSMGSFGYLAGSFLGGLSVDKRGLKFVTLLGGICITAGLLLYMSFENYILFAAGFVISGIGGGILEIGINGAVPAVSKSVEDQARYFNWLHGFYGIGATGLPLLSVWFLRAFPDWRSGFWFELALLGLILLFVLLFPYGNVTTKRQEVTREPVPIKKAEGYPKLVGLLLAIMTYVMAEVGFATWLPSYLIQVRNVTLTEVAFYLSGFYLIFTFGRLSAHWWINRIGQEKAVMFSSTMAMATFGIAMWENQATLVFFVVSGISFSAIFPTIAAIACHLYADNAGKILGFLFAASGIGAMLANGIIGVVANNYGLETGFSVILLFLGSVVLCMLCVIRLNKPKVAGAAQGRQGP
ncbi:MAG: transporter [Brevibacillus sp.]|nr:transporter [Brevibacillus sp.]